MPQATTEAPTRRRAGDAASERILAALSTIAQAVNQVRLHERLLSTAGVRVDRAGAALLAKLQRSGDVPLRVTSLAEQLGVDTPTVTRKVQQLERLGLVERAADPDDGRANRIGLTDEGRETLARLTAAKRRWLDGMLEGWTAADRTSLAGLLSTFADRLHDDLGGARVD